MVFLKLSQARGVDSQGEMWELCVWEAPRCPLCDPTVPPLIKAGS